MKSVFVAVLLTLGPAFWVPLLFFLVGLVLLFAEVRFGQRAVVTEGEVMDLHYHRGVKGRGTYRPVVRFHAVDEQHREEEIIFESRVGQALFGQPLQEVGDRVPVLYDPRNPKRARINTFSSRWLLPCLCVGMGIVSPAFFLLPFLRI